MKTPEYKNTSSLWGKSRVVLALLGIIPLLLVVYVFVNENITVTDKVSLFSALAIFSILAGFSLLRRSADQLGNLSRKINSIGAGEHQEPILINADQELNDIAANFNLMLNELNQTQRDMKQQGIQLMVYARDLSLSHKKIREEEALRYKLSRYVGENLVERLLEKKNRLFIENERKEVTILFADIRSFTTIAERLAPEEVLSMLNIFFSAMVDIVFKYNGVLDKFIGDELMAVFGLIHADDRAPNEAVQAAIEMQDATEQLMKQRATDNKETFSIGIGINTGDAVVGNVGCENRMDYTVIGTSVNIAARLQKVARGGEILMSEQTYRQTQSHFPMKKRGAISLEGTTEPVTCYQLKR